jgi:predicted hydrocarbon binding protein
MSSKNQMISGENFFHIEDFVKYKWGTEGLRSYKEQIELRVDKIYNEKLYPFEDYVECLRIVQNLFKSEALAYEIGWHRARHLLLVRGIDSQGIKVLEKVASSWNRFNNFGKVAVEKHDDNKISVFISDYNSNPLYCERMRGFFSGLVCSDKKKNCNVNEVSCVRKGDKACEFLIEIEK